jgi:hypothetical protein
MRQELEITTSQAVCCWILRRASTAVGRNTSLERWRLQDIGVFRTPSMSRKRMAYGFMAFGG